MTTKPLPQIPAIAEISDDLPTTSELAHLAVMIASWRENHDASRSEMVDEAMKYWKAAAKFLRAPKKQ